MTILLIASFAGSLLTAAAGVGGGSLLLIVMASILPPVALIPVHGIVQLGSNSLRFSLTHKHVQSQLVLPFLLGSIAAAGLGALLLGRFDTQWLPLIVSVFVIWTCWGSLPQFSFGQSKLGMTIGGLLTSYASLFIGASGPLVSAWIGANNKDRFQYTANFSACMTVQHTFKLVVFGVLGFVFYDWLLLALGMVACGYAGTKLGLHALRKLPQKHFQVIFKLMLTALCLRLLWVSYF